MYNDKVFKSFSVSVYTFKEETTLQALDVGATSKFSLELHRDQISTYFLRCSNVMCPLGISLMKVINNRGNSGSPCFRPNYTLKKSDTPIDDASRIQNFTSL